MAASSGGERQCGQRQGADRNGRKGFDGSARTGSARIATDWQDRTGMARVRMASNGGASNDAAGEAWNRFDRRVEQSRGPARLERSGVDRHGQARRCEVRLGQQGHGTAGVERFGPARTASIGARGAVANGWTGTARIRPVRGVRSGWERHSAAGKAPSAQASQGLARPGMARPGKESNRWRGMEVIGLARKDSVRTGEAGAARRVEDWRGAGWHAHDRRGRNGRRGGAGRRW